MPKITKRGYVPTDAKQFSPEAMPVLRNAGEEVCFLLNRGYSVKSATTFVGNHHLLSERQRLALARMISPEAQIRSRLCRQLTTAQLKDAEVSVDGFNVIITLEIAFSDSLLLRCMDGTVRDLAGLRGTYTLIDKTDMAIAAMRGFFAQAGVREVVIYLDAPVSNSGRLRQRILEQMEHAGFGVSVRIENPVDALLKQKSHVMTADAIILDACQSWYNLTYEIIQREIGAYHYVQLGMPAADAQELSETPHLPQQVADIGLPGLT